MASIGAAVEGEPRGAATRTPHLALGATRVGLSASQTDAVPIPAAPTKEPPNPEP